MLTNSPVACPAATRSITLVAFGLLLLAIWMIQHPYQGIEHDAVLYTLFGLERLHPDSLHADVFLRFGSQDSFSVFAPLYSTAMRLFGM